MENTKIFEMLFNEHHRHLSEIKQKIQGQSQRTILILTAAIGWLISQPQISIKLQFIIAMALFLIGLSTVCAIRRHNKNYRAEAKIISKINNSLGLFEKGRFIDNVSIYPDSWKRFGEEPICHGLWHHIITIMAMTILSIFAAFM